MIVAVASQAGAQTRLEPAETADSVAFAAIPVDNRLSLHDLQVTPISTWRMSEADLEKQRLEAALTPKSFAPRSVQVPLSSARKSTNKALKRTLAGVAGGVGGFFAGGLIGAKLDGDCNCDDPGLLGFVIGGPIGAAVGAIFGVWSVR